jgi:hypothetical protein
VICAPQAVTTESAALTKPHVKTGSWRPDLLSSGVYLVSARRIAG